ncbi:TonB-dependent receptor [Novosphingobium aerophilum]|uniref:TonB-dependent receptor n=1 Tax=Novosphingobium TaxID=165696 RepID=UPI0006C88AD1|nr:MULTISPECIES: TonB-dependent receptor [unclassified Novosphingobium]KPH64504.1 TonB-dependent receptor [Novosphingobium sp. ST904]MPS68682.1 TonB-dependent receptor [Novosphingobium sp.]TCM31154.1 TonB-dependent receptor [Novosphingobium sp. ST904]WRT93593.1 TonB-dependent receptor [Novosphingobium sp. RL4]
MALKPFAFCTASVFALSLATVAHAQDAAPQAADAAEPTAEDIIVTGVRASIVGAINSRKENIQIVDSIVAEDVGKLPDNNVIEALQRVTGIQVTDRAGGETGTITIRGLSDPVTTWNGRNIFTAAGTSFALQDISSNLVRKIDVYKTRSADQLEFGLAGQIDVATRRPFDFDGFTISGLARGVYSELADKVNPNVALLVSDRWETGIGDIGFLINGSYTRSKYRNMNVQAGALVPFATENPPSDTWLTPLQRIFPNTDPANPYWKPGLNAGLPTTPGSTLNIDGVEVPYYLSRDAVISSDLYGKRERPSINAALQWAPNDRSTYTAEFYYTGFRGSTFNSMLFSFADWWGDLGDDPGSTFELYDGTNVIKSRKIGGVSGFNSADYSTNKTDSYVYALNADWDVGDRGKITADLAYQDSKNETSFFAVRTNRAPLDIDVDFNAGGGIPSYSFGTPGVLTDATQWTVGDLFDNGNRSTGKALTFQLDGYYEWDEGFLRRIKAGFRYDDRKASTFIREQSAGALGGTLASLGDGYSFTNSGFFDGRADVPTSWVLANGPALYKNADAIRTLYQAANPNLLLSDQLSFGRVFDINEVTLAAYLLADGQVEIFGRPLMLEGGVRMVTIDTDYDYFDRYNDYARTGVSTGQMKFLPSFTARYEITPNLRVRFNYGETLRRPAFGDLNPNVSLTGDLSGLGFGTGSAGNAGLKATTSKNFDLALEWYFERNSAIYVTGFRREISGLVVPLTTLEYIPNNGIEGSTATDYFQVTRPTNASDGVLKGVELGLTYFPTYLPSVLDGLGFQGSATILDSSQTIPETDDEGNTVLTKSAFFAVSKFSYNATLAYERGPIGARLSYVWRKGFLQRNEARAFANPIGFWRKPEKSLDFQLTFAVTDDIGLTFDAVNITKAKQQDYYKFEDAGGPVTMNANTLLIDRTFAAGVRFKF